MLNHPLLASDPLETHREEICSAFLASILRYPKEARECLVDPMICSTMDQQHLYEAIRSVVAHGREPSVDELTEHFRARNQTFECLLPYVNAKVLRTPSEIVPKAKAVITAIRVKDALHNVDHNIESMNFKAINTQLMTALNAGASSVSAKSSIKDLVTSAVNTIELNRSDVSFGWPTLDRMLKLYPGDMLVVGADAGIGKSTALLTWCLHMASMHLPVAFISAEDDQRTLGTRLVSALVDIPLYKWGLTHWTQEDQSKLEGINHDIPFNSFYVPTGDVNDVIRCMTSAVFSGCKVVAVDYFQALTSPGRFSGDTERYNDILNRLIVAAKQLNVVLLLASQIRRRPPSNKSRDNFDGIPEPGLEDLLGTGHLGRRAQAVVMLWGDRSESVRGRLAKAKNAGAGSNLILRRHATTGRLEEL